MQVLTSEYNKASRHYRMVPNLDRGGSIFSCLVFHGDIEYFSVAVETTTALRTEVQFMYVTISR